MVPFAYVGKVGFRCEKYCYVKQTLTFGEDGMYFCDCVFMRVSLFSTKGHPTLSYNTAVQFRVCPPGQGSDSVGRKMDIGQKDPKNYLCVCVILALHYYGCLSLI